MAQKIQTSQVLDLQQIEAVVAGPDGANRLFSISGRINVSIFAASSNANTVTQKETFLVLLGPVLTRRQFVKASGTVAITGVQTSTQTTPATTTWNLTLLDSDWDDETGQVELKIEFQANSSGTNNSVQILGATFQVTILAELTND